MCRPAGSSRPAPRAPSTEKARERLVRGEVVIAAKSSAHPRWRQAPRRRKARQIRKFLFSLPFAGQNATIGTELSGRSSGGRRRGGALSSVMNLDLGLGGCACPSPKRNGNRRGRCGVSGAFAVLGSALALLVACSSPTVSMFDQPASPSPTHADAFRAAGRRQRVRNGPRQGGHDLAADPGRPAQRDRAIAAQCRSARGGGSGGEGFQRRHADDPG